MGEGKCFIARYAWAIAALMQEREPQFTWSSVRETILIQFSHEFAEDYMRHVWHEYEQVNLSVRAAKV